MISLGFAFALWSGSRAVNVFIDTITVMYGLDGQRGIVKTRLLAFLLYLVALVDRRGRAAADGGRPGRGRCGSCRRRHWLVTSFYWPTVLLLSIAFLTTLYHVSVPVRSPWREDIPGALVALGMWVLGSFLLRLYLTNTVEGPTIYGSLAAPVAVLLWIGVSAFAVLVGAAVNAAIDRVWPSAATAAARERHERHRVLSPAHLGGDRHPRGDACSPMAVRCKPSSSAFGFDERTVRRWMARAGRQGQAVQEHLVEQPRDLGQVQADEIRVKKQGGIVWMALAMMVKTRLWLGGEVSEQRDMPLIRRLIERVRRCAAHRPLLVCTDGLVSYIRAIRETFRDPVHTGTGGRPRLRPWRNVLIAQVVKRYERRRVVETERRIVDGTPARVETLRRRSQGDGVINTAYIEVRPVGRKEARSFRVDREVIINLVTQFSMRVQVPPSRCRSDSVSPRPATGSQRSEAGINGGPWKPQSGYPV